MCTFDLSFVSYIVFLLVFRFYRAAVSAVNAVLLSSICMPATRPLSLMHVYCLCVLRRASVQCAVYGMQDGKCVSRSTDAE